MTTRQRPQQPAPHPPEGSQSDELFRFGYRYVRQRQPDGRDVFTRVALTREDVLHPQEEDVQLHNDQHENVRGYLRQVLDARLADVPRARAFSDLRFAWNAPIGALGPDVAVVFGVRKRRRWTTFDVTAEGVRPVLVFEITSPETRTLDLEEKVALYAQAGISYYVIIDLLNDRRAERIELRGYQLTPGGYVRFLADARGWLWLEPIQLWLGAVPAEGDDAARVYFYDAQGNQIPDYRAVYQAGVAAEARAQAEAQARSEAEARLQALEEELRRLRGG